jgi:hypothetical protein
MRSFAALRMTTRWEVTPRVRRGAARRIVLATELAWSKAAAEPPHSKGSRGGFRIEGAVRAPTRMAV